GEELRRAALEPLVASLQPDESTGPRGFRLFLDLVYLLARHDPAIGHDDAAHASTGRDRLFRDRELGRTEDLRRVHDLQAVARIRAIAAIPLHRLAVRHARERRLDGLARGAPDRADHPLGERRDVFARDERALDVDLREFRLAVGTEILVAKAARDLEVAVEAGNHEQLLVDLRRLRERIELTRMHAAGHEIVPRAFGRRFRQDRRLELEK